MSVDGWTFMRRTVVILAWACAAAAGAQAGAADRIPGAGGSEQEHVFDPLNTQPAMLDRGATLPGDASLVDCPSRPTVPLHPLALGEAVDLALCNSPQLQETWIGIRVQAAQLGQSRAAWLPTVTSSITTQRTRTTYPDIPSSNTTQNGQTVYADVTWRLFDFGARSASNASAARLLDAALAAHDAALQKTLSSVVQAYFDALTARAVADGRAEAARFAQQIFEATQRREARGAAPVNDVLQANAAYAKAKLAEQRAEGDFRKLRSALLYACGLPPEADVELAREVEPIPSQAVADLKIWLDTAAARHPALLAAAAQVDAARAKVDVVRAQGLPSIDASGNYYRNGYPNQALQTTRSNNAMVGITLNVPLFEGFARTYQINEARAQVELAEAQLRDLRLQVLSSVVKDHADATAALANLESSATLLQATEAAVGSARRRYEHGEGDVLELLTAESAYTDARQERIRCIAEWRSARLRLFADAGTLDHVELTGNAVVP